MNYQIYSTKLNKGAMMQILRKECLLHRVLNDSSETLRELYVSTEFSHRESRRNYGILFIYLFTLFNVDYNSSNIY